MRISDWSSDVCSSDLGGGSFFHIRKRFRIEHQAVANAPLDIVVGRHPPSLTRAGRQIKVHRILAHGHDNRETDEQTLDRRGLGRNARFRSEEHTSEIQSLMRSSYAVFCLKKKH